MKCFLKVLYMQRHMPDASQDLCRITTIKMHGGGRNTRYQIKMME